MGDESERPWDPVSGSKNNSCDPANSVIGESNVAFSEIDKIIDEVYSMVGETIDYSLYIRFLPWLLLQFRKPKSRNSQATFNSIFLTGRQEDAFEFLLLEIRNRIAQHVF